jgi:cytoskeletal protein CcmA (bactofilin family)
MLFGKARNIDSSIREFEKMRDALKRAEHPLGGDVAPAGETTSATKGAEPLAPLSTASPISMTNTADIPAPTDPGSSVVSKGTIWQGTLKVEGSVRIDGQLSGEVEARQLVYVSEGAEVDAQIRAAMVTIGGRFQGKVHCTERLEILPTGRVTADLTTKSLVVHEGAFLEGQIHMEVEAPKTASHTPSKEKVLDAAAELVKASSLGTSSSSSSLGSSSLGSSGSTTSHGPTSLGSTPRNPSS